MQNFLFFPGTTATLSIMSIGVILKDESGALHLLTWKGEHIKLYGSSVDEWKCEGNGPFHVRLADGTVTEFGT